MGEQDTSGQDTLADRFEAQRTHLQAVAYRMLGSVAEAEDAVQESWIRLSRADVSGVQNLAGWLTTVIARLCLDQLRARAARPWRPFEDLDPADGRRGVEPELEAQVADSVGRALLVVLDTLAPAERIAFVLHDVFAVPFAQIAPIVARTPAATKKLTSRARVKLRAGPAGSTAELARQRPVVEAFLAATRAGDLAALLAVLAPDVVRRADPAALPPGAEGSIRGAARVAEEIRTLSGGRARSAEPALVDGRPGAIVTRGGRLLVAMVFTIADGRITAFTVRATPARITPWPGDVR